MSTPRRTAFFVSDRTGITAEMLGHSLLTQFDQVGFTEVTLPFVDSEASARASVERINQAAREDGTRPLVFSTLVSEALSDIVREADGFYIDCFQAFIAPLEAELGVPSSHAVGRSHSVRDNAYLGRMEAVNFALASDDGQDPRKLAGADIVLVGISRCGKTPTCLYLAMQYGIRAANYPLTPDDLDDGMQLPSALDECRDRLFGLTIRPERLERIRNERRPGSSYAALSNCEQEVRAAEALMRGERLPMLDTTHRSVEEIATVICQEAHLRDP